MKYSSLLFLYLGTLSPFPVLALQHRPAIIAHRGASASAPENTLEAFRLALEEGADILELDVRQTRDSQLIVIHDETIDRTTNGKGNVKDIAYEDLRRYDAGSWFGSGAFSGARIPRLEDVIGALDTTTQLLIEIKDGSDVYPNIEQRVVNCVEKNRLEKRSVIKSFDDEILNAVRGIHATLPLLKVFVVQFPALRITIGRGIAFGNVMEKNVQYLQPHWLGLTKRFVEAAHDKGFKVFVWDVNTESRMRKMIEFGVDGIETDHPAALRKLLPLRDE
ncbi:MAG TPA: glycerophosphodiester phosphodiesterase family protein [Bacteroidota bacterium]|jgi:glycerophosphoryl diester phosphodiesterase|nr:glycerophosphodiester phosphodiesterase family protein [Bacteroidota bacterium]